MTKTGARKTMPIPPHMIPTNKDRFREVQIPLYDQVPPPGWGPNGERQQPAKQERRVWITDVNGNDITDGEDGDSRRERPAYNPDVPRWNF